MSGTRCLEKLSVTDTIVIQLYQGLGNNILVNDLSMAVRKKRIVVLVLIVIIIGLMYHHDVTVVKTEKVSGNLAIVPPRSKESSYAYGYSDGNSSTISSAQRFVRQGLQTKERCKRLNPEGADMLRNATRAAFSRGRFIASMEKRLIMCLSLKAGSSTWHDLFWQFRDPAAAAKQQFFESAVFGNIRYYEALSTEQRIALWQDPLTVKMMNTRHPFARLISGWDDKFTKRYFHNRWFNEFPLLKNYSVEYPKWNGVGHFMTWPNFARYVAENGHDLKNLDGHFHPVSADCNPCKIPFDLIIKAETFYESLSWLLSEKLGTDPKKLRLKNFAKKQEDSVLKIRKMFQQLDQNTIRSLIGIYQTDMDIFGYTFDLEMLTAGGWE